VNCAADKCKGETGGAAATKNIKILAPTEGDVEKTKLDFYVSIAKGSKTKKLVYVVFKDGESAVVSEPFTVDDSDKADVAVSHSVEITKGESTVSFMDPEHVGEAAFVDKVKINCNDKCAGASTAQTKSEFSVEQPASGSTADTGVLDTYLKFEKDTKVKKLRYEVLNDERVFVGDSKEITIKDDKPTVNRVPVRLAQGTNTITFYNADDPGNVDEKKTITVKCDGIHCPDNFDIVKFPSNSQNSRVVVGMEQAGASSAKSESRPFLDFFFSTPFIFDSFCKMTKKDGKDDREAYEACKNSESQNRDKKIRVPRAGFWGQVRFTSSPTQLATASVLPSSLVNQVTNPNEVVNLVQSFDFLAGLELRLKTANGNFLSLIPGVRQRTSFWITGGMGAISPLESNKQAVQIFKIPETNDPQRAEYERRYGVPPNGKTNIAILPLDRERFFRQWYAGIRLKTHYCEDTPCFYYVNSFPAIVDFSVGQNEAVTGGSLYYFKQRDPNDPTDLQKKHWYVFRLDAFYPFPIKEASFLYFYGSAVMKLGGGGKGVQSPLFLVENNDLKLSDPSIFIPSTDILKTELPNRDYYKIGVGVNLTDLFNRNKNPRE
jgi:hypothetical protein